MSSLSYIINRFMPELFILAPHLQPVLEKAGFVGSFIEQLRSVQIKLNNKVEFSPDELESGRRVYIIFS